MIHCRGNNMIAFFKKALNGYIQGMSAVRGKSYPQRDEKIKKNG